MSRINLDYRQQTDSDGNPLSAARAYTFAAGTMTPTPLYSDEARSVSFGDYVLADSAGVFPDAYGDPAQGYYIEYRLADGTTVIDTSDNLYPDLDASDTDESLAALGIANTAAGVNVDTSGDAVGKLNTANFYSALQTFLAGLELNSTSAAATAGPTLRGSRDSISPAPDDLIMEIVFDGKDSAGNDTEYASLTGEIIDETTTEEDGALLIHALLAATKTLMARIGSLDSAAPTTTGLDLLEGEYYRAGELARGTPIALIEGQQTSGTDGGDFASGADRTVTLNTEVFDTFNIVSVSGNTVTISAPGTYLIIGYSLAHDVRLCQLILYDGTGTADIKRGLSLFVDDITADESEPIDIVLKMEVMDQVTIGASNDFQLHARCTLTQNTNGFGMATSLGQETYAGFLILKG